METESQKVQIKFEPLGGYCTTPVLFDKRKNKPDPNGIFSETIFGPIHNNRCACGFLKHKTLDYGKVCPRCGTICGDSSLRMTTFGKIKTLVPFIKFPKIKDIIRIIGNKNKQLINPEQSDLNMELTRYIALHKSKSHLKIINSYDEIDHKSYIVIPMKITGLYTLVFVFKYLATHLKVEFIRDLFDKDFITDEIAVLPPDVRPIFRNPKKPNELIRTQVNDFYVSLLNFNKRNEMLYDSVIEDEKNWRQKITYDLKNHTMTDLCDPVIIEYERMAAFYQFYINKIYNTCYDTIRGKKGLIRESVLGRTIEFSSRHVIAVDPKVKPYEIQVPKSSLYVLWMPYFLHYLVTKHRVTCSAAVLEYKIPSKRYDDIKKDPFLNKEFNEFLDWFCNSDEAKNYQFLMDKKEEDE